MTLPTIDLRDPRKRPAERFQDRSFGIGWLLAVLAAIAILRLIALFLSPSELGFDEAQYFLWSQHFDFGYFTKPPLIAWTIAAETKVCGTGAACVRSLVPLVNCATALVLALLARRLYGAATGFWTGVFFAIMPGIAVSSFLMTTDPLLLFFWSLALYAVIGQLDAPGIKPALLFGIAAGLGLNAKYAMIYLPALVAFATVVMPKLRAKIWRRESLLALAVMLVLIAPNLIWNGLHGFATFEHTAHDNIGWSLARLNAQKGFEFLGAQFGIAGPVIFGAMVNALVLRARTEAPRTDVLLLLLSWPILFAITVQGFLAQANVNWGATAYPAGVIVATALVIRHRWRFFFWTNLIVCGALSLALLAGTAFFDPAMAPRAGKQLRQMAGWNETADNLQAFADKAGAARIVVEGRALTAGIAYAMRDAGLPVLTYLPKGDGPSDGFQMDRPWNGDDVRAGTLLFGFDADAAKRLGAHQLGSIGAPLYSSRTGTMPVYGFSADGGDKP
ncbi:glycosyltransferase family 39 protein [Jiella sp. MQZ9-1]|uniref:Glycosyltransferase family 39 protein n=1 Tax=Jiella flava TaxID=2816857 RepID=A0A939FWL8_9HYPH|nr:glycosyltransferase family 39 protein [Jiella flava]MBO0661586.1 glycosyltransferase family 39 protein [Jiella flava]MCD2470228.1 glycosyltransferase family 39 protein [Jiella flava]